MAPSVMNQGGVGKGFVAGAFLATFALISLFLWGGQRLSGETAQPLDASKTPEKEEGERKTEGLVGRVETLEKELRALAARYTKKVAEFEALKKDYNELTAGYTKKIAELDALKKDYNEQKKETVQFGSKIQLQVQNKELIIGIKGAKVNIGNVVDIGPLKDNDNWFTVIRRPGR